MMNTMDYTAETMRGNAEENLTAGFEQAAVMTDMGETAEANISAGIMTEMPVEQENNISEADAEMEQLLNEVEQNLQESSYMDAAPTAEPEADFDASVAASTDTAVITAGMNITGDVTSSGNMDLIGSITGNIEIFGKLNVTGSITGNSAAAEIYAESAQINGEVKSKGSVKIGQSSVVIGNIFATSAVIAGAVKGDIDVHGPVILDTSAIVMGNIKSKSVQINNGAVIEGMCSQCYADVSPSAFFNDVKKNRKQS
ncbi:MAG: polymer-forming cytoskeletal protein [Lachnospiraceae bacterium]|nr:polymer-forming cytoskeletal protein [Lachnospiraceae bacterium]